MKDMELEHRDCSDLLTRQVHKLEYSAEQEERLKKELEVMLFGYCYYSQETLKLWAILFLWDESSQFSGDFCLLNWQNFQHPFCRVDWVDQCHLLCVSHLRLVFEQQMEKRLNEYDSKAKIRKPFFLTFSLSMQRLLFFLILFFFV